LFLVDLVYHILKPKFIKYYKMTNFLITTLTLSTLLYGDRGLGDETNVKIFEYLKIYQAQSGLFILTFYVLHVQYKKYPKSVCTY
jgi:hypothetical protein